MQQPKHEILSRLCRGQGFAANLACVTSQDLAVFECSTVIEFEKLITTAMSDMKGMVGIETETLAIECALALDGGQATNLTGRREEFLLGESISLRTLMRKEERGINLMIVHLERMKNKKPSLLAGV